MDSNGGSFASRAPRREPYVIGQNNSVVCISIPADAFKTARPRSLGDMDLSKPGARNLFRAVQFMVRVFENPNIGSVENSFYFMDHSEPNNSRLRPKFTLVMEPLFRSPVGIKRLREEGKKLHRYLLEKDYPEHYQALEEYSRLYGTGSRRHTASSYSGDRDDDDDDNNNDDNETLMSAFDLTYQEWNDFHAGTASSMSPGYAGGGGTTDDREQRRLARLCAEALHYMSQPNLCYEHIGDDLEMQRMTREFWRRYRTDHPNAFPYSPMDDDEEESDADDMMVSDDDDMINEEREEERRAFASEFGEEEGEGEHRRSRRAARGGRRQRKRVVHKIGTRELLHENFAGVRLMWVVHDPKFNVMQAIQSSIFSNAARVIGHHFNASRRANQHIDSRSFPSVDFGAYYAASSQMGGGGGMMPMLALPGKRKRKKKKKKQQQRRSFLENNPADPRPAHDSDDDDDDEYDDNLFGDGGGGGGGGGGTRQAAPPPVDDDDDDDDEEEEEEFNVSFNEAETALSAAGIITDPDRYSDSICTYMRFANDFVNVLCPAEIPNAALRRVQITDDLKTEGYDLYNTDTRANPLHVNSWTLSGFWAWNASHLPVCTVQTSPQNYLRQDVSTLVDAERGSDSNASGDFDDDGGRRGGALFEADGIGSDDDDDDDDDVLPHQVATTTTAAAAGQVVAANNVKAVFSLPFTDIPVMELKPEEARWNVLKNQTFPWSATSHFETLASLLEVWRSELRRLKHEEKVRAERLHLDINTYEQNTRLRGITQIKAQMMQQLSGTCDRDAFVSTRDMGSSSGSTAGSEEEQSETFDNMVRALLEENNESQTESDDLMALRDANQKNYRRLIALQGVPEFEPYMYQLVSAYFDMTIDDFTLVYSPGRKLSRALRMIMVWKTRHITMAHEFPTIDPQLGRIGSVYAMRVLSSRHVLRQVSVMEAFHESIYTVYGVYSMPATDREEFGSAYKCHFGNLGPSGISKSFLTTCIKDCMIEGTIDRRDSMSDGAHVSEDHRDQVIVFDEAPAFLVSNSRSLSSTDYNRAQNFKVMLSEQELSYSTTDYDRRTGQRRGVTQHKNVSMVIIYNTNRQDVNGDKGLQNRIHMHTASTENDGAFKITDAIGRTADGADKQKARDFKTYLQKEQFVTCTVMKMLGTRTIPFYPEISLAVLYWQKVLQAMSAEDRHVFNEVRALQRALRSAFVRTITDAHDMVHNSEVAPALMRNQRTGEVMYRKYTHSNLMNSITPALFAREDGVIANISAELGQFYDPVTWEVVCFAAQAFANFKFEIPERWLKKALNSKSSSDDDDPVKRHFDILQVIQERNAKTAGTGGAVSYLDMFETNELAIFTEEATIHPDREYYIPYDENGKRTRDNATYRRFEDNEGAVFLDHDWLVIKGFKLRRFAEVLAGRLGKRGFDAETILHILYKAKSMKITAYKQEPTPLYHENMKRKTGDGDGVLPVRMPEHRHEREEFSVLKYVPGETSDEGSCEIHICTHYMRHDPDSKLRTALRALSHRHTRERYIVISRPVACMPHYRMLYYLRKNNRPFKLYNALYINEGDAGLLFEKDAVGGGVQMSDQRREQYIEIDEDVEEYFARQHFKRIGEEKPGQFDCYLPRVVDQRIRELYDDDPWLRRKGRNLTREKQYKVDQITREMDELPPKVTLAQWMEKFVPPPGASPKQERVARMRYSTQWADLEKRRFKLQMDRERAKLSYPFDQIESRKKELAERAKADADQMEDHDQYMERANQTFDVEKRWKIQKLALIKEGAIDADPSTKQEMFDLQHKINADKERWKMLYTLKNKKRTHNEIDAEDNISSNNKRRKKSSETTEEPSSTKKPPSSGRRKRTNLARYRAEQDKKNARIIAGGESMRDSDVPI